MEQGPSSRTRPQLLSVVLHAPLKHADMAESDWQVPSSTGTWPGISGMGKPFATFGTHVFDV